MNIREATQSDIPQISALVKSLAHYYLDGAKAQLPVWLADTLTDDAFLSRVSSEEYVNFLCEIDSEVVGYIAVKAPNHLYHLFVAEPFQGQGISRILWEHVLSHKQYDSFSLRSSLYAVPVYKRFGFIESGEVGTKDGVSFQPMVLTL